MQDSLGKGGALLKSCSPRFSESFVPVTSQEMERGWVAGFPGEVRAASGQIACGGDSLAPKKVLSSQGQQLVSALTIRSGWTENMARTADRLGADLPPWQCRLPPRMPLRNRQKRKAGLSGHSVDFGAMTLSVFQSPTLCLSLEVYFHLFGKISFGK